MLNRTSPSPNALSLCPTAESTSQSLARLWYTIKAAGCMLHLDTIARMITDTHVQLISPLTVGTNFKSSPTTTEAKKLAAKRIIESGMPTASVTSCSYWAINEKIS